MKTKNGHTKRPLMTPLAVMHEVGEKLPHLYGNLRRDRDWVWLAVEGKPEPEDREILKQIGFSFAKNGHRIGDEIAYWGHSCLKPIPRRRRSKGGRSQPANAGSRELMSSLSESDDAYLIEFLS